MKQCRHVLTVSEFTRQEMIRGLNFQQPGLHAPTTACVPTCVRCRANRLRLRVGVSVCRGSICFSSARSSGKNPLLLMRAYCELPATERNRCPLVLAGSWGWNAAEFRAYFESTARHCGVMHLGYVPDQDLAVLSRRRSGAVFPSHYEGFGLPPLEMMACGRRVWRPRPARLWKSLAQRRDYIDPADLEGGAMPCAALLRRMIGNAKLSGVTELVAAFTWERFARQTLGVYRALLERESANPLRRAA